MRTRTNKVEKNHCLKSGAAINGEPVTIVARGSQKSTPLVRYLKQLFEAEIERLQESEDSE